jgi:hypothetical protein
MERNEDKEPVFDQLLHMTIKKSGCLLKTAAYVFN